MRLTGISMAAMLCAGVAMADSVAPGDVVYDDAGAVALSLTGVPGDPKNGAAIMSSKKKGNCIACHQVDALKDAPFHGEVGPALNGVGGVRTAAELRGIVADAKRTFPDSMMPPFYRVTGFIRPGKAYTGKAAKPEELTPILSAQDIEDVVAFLLTLKDG